MYRKLLMLIAVSILLATTNLQSIQEQGEEETSLYLQIPPLGPGWEAFVSLTNLSHETVDFVIEPVAREQWVLGTAKRKRLSSGSAWSFEIQNLDSEQGYALRLRASGKVDAIAVLRSPEGHNAEVLSSAPLPSRHLILPLLPQISGCTPVAVGQSGEAIRVQILNTSSQEARVEVHGLAAEGQEIGRVDLQPLAPHENRTLVVSELFKDSSRAVTLASIRLFSDQPLLGMQWRPSGRDVVGLYSLASGTDWRIAPVKVGDSHVDATLSIYNPGETAANVVLRVLDDGWNSIGLEPIQPGEIRELSTARSGRGEVLLDSDNPIAVYATYRSKEGCGMAAVNAIPNRAGLPRQEIEVDFTHSGSVLAVWPPIPWEENRSRLPEVHRSAAGNIPYSSGEELKEEKGVIISPASVTSETLSFRHPVDQVSVSASCDLGGACAGSTSNRHTAVDYGTGNTNPPAFASNFGLLRQAINYNQNVGCGSLSCNMGTTVVIEYLQTNGEKWISVDSHLASRSVSAIGGRIAKGQQIGIVGCSGSSLCSWCTNSSSCTNNKHAHHEHKRPDLGTYDLWPFGYMTAAEANQLRRSGEASISISEAISRAFTTVNNLRSQGIRVLIPYLSPFTSSPGLGSYEVYGVANTPLNAAISLTPTTSRTFTNIGVGGRRWENESSNADVFIRASETFRVNETRSLSGANTFSEGDYRFFSYIERHQEAAVGRGYGIKFAMLPNSSSVVVDNDSRSGYTASENGATTGPGYFLSAKLFAGSSDNWAQWRPGRSGLFEIWAHVPPGATARQISYKIYTNGTSSIRTDVVNHSNSNDRWVKLTAGSTQSWSLSSGAYVGLSVENIPTSEKVGADAIKFIYLGSGNSGAPTAPSNLTASTDSALRAILFWNDNSSNETGFKIERRTSTSGAWSQITTLGAGATGYADNGLAPSATYFYRVRATNNTGDSPYSNEVSITTVGGGCSPSTYTITPGQSIAGNLSTTDCYSSVRTSSYHDRFAFIATAGVSYNIAITSTSFDTFLVLKNASGTVVATNDDADGTNSRIVHTAASSGTYTFEATSFTSLTTGPYNVFLSGSGSNSGVPAAPSNLNASTDSVLRAILFWNDNSSNETGFKIERKIGTAGSWSQLATLGPNSTGYADTGLSPSTTYVYRIRATNGSGDSPYSNEASITTVAGSCSSSNFTITPGQSLASELSSSDCNSSVRTSSYCDRFAFTATAGVSYTIAMSSSSFDTYLVLKNASGTVVATNDDTDGTTNSRIVHTAASSGTYTIEATSFQNSATGPYTVSLSGSGSGSGCSSSFSPILPGLSANGTLSTTDCYSTVRTSRYHDKFVFAGTAGRAYTIVLTSSEFDTYLILRGPSGAVVAENDDNNGGTDSRITFTAASSGAYTIEATSFSSNATGRYTISMAP
ncbi:MAG TPA: fibronectin type III domain-containing protein [Thermoanaerobaculia bacterium]